MTGRPASGTELERLGLVNRVFPRADVVPEALRTARAVAALSGPVVRTAKQAVLLGAQPGASIQERWTG